MAIGATYISLDPGHYRVTDTDMALSNSLVSDDTMALGGDTDHLYMYGPAVVQSPDSNQATDSGLHSGPLHRS